MYVKQIYTNCKDNCWQGRFRLCIVTSVVNRNMKMKSMITTKGYFNFGRFFFGFRSVHPVGWGEHSAALNPGWTSLPPGVFIFMKGPGKNLGAFFIGWIINEQKKTSFFATAWEGVMKLKQIAVPIENSHKRLYELIGQLANWDYIEMLCIKEGYHEKH